MIFTSLEDERFGNLFVEFELSAFRLETLQHYDVSYEEGPFRDYLDGVARYTHPDQAAYADLVAGKIAGGASMSRVHVVTEPVSAYIRFELTWPYVDSAAAGEDVRVIVVGEDDWPADVPRTDFWLFDDAVAVMMEYAEDGRFVSAQVTREPAVIADCLRSRDAALRLSRPHDEVLRTLLDRAV